MTIATLALVAVLAADPKGVSLAAPGFQAVNVDAKVATFASDHFAQSMVESGVKAMTSSEVTAIIGLERQKQLLGCSDNSASCMAELAGALGTDGLIAGSLGKFGTKYQVNIKVLSAGDGRTLAVTSFKVDNDEQLMDQLSSAADAMAKELFRVLGRQPLAMGRVKVPNAPPAQQAQQPGLTQGTNQQPVAVRPIPVVITNFGGGVPMVPGQRYRARGVDFGGVMSIVLGTGLALGGGACFFMANNIGKELRGEVGATAWTSTFRDASTSAFFATWVFQPLGGVLLLAGGLSILGAITGATERVPVASLTVGPSGLAFSFSGSIP